MVPKPAMVALMVDETVIQQLAETTRMAEMLGHVVMV
jgi:hypothetical protein